MTNKAFSNEVRKKTSWVRIPETRKQSGQVYAKCERNLPFVNYFCPILVTLFLKIP